MTSKDTTALIREAQDGDAAALDELFRRHRGRLLAWVRFVLRAETQVAAEDVVQETYLAAARRLADFRREQGRFYPWLVGIAKRKAKEARRAAPSAGADLGSEESDRFDVAARQTSVPGRVVREENRQSLERHLGALPEQQRRAVVLRYLEGLSVAETASRLECSEAAVKSLVWRGMQELARRHRGD